MAFLTLTRVRGTGKARPTGIARSGFANVNAGRRPAVALDAAVLEVIHGRTVEDGETLDLIASLVSAAGFGSTSGGYLRWRQREERS